jgi:hypothetical protein
LLVIDRAAEFLVVDRIPEDGGEDCEVLDLSPQDIWLDVRESSLNPALTIEVALRDLSAYRLGNTGIDFVHRFESGAPART